MNEKVLTDTGKARRPYSLSPPAPARNCGTAALVPAVSMEPVDLNQVVKAMEAYLRTALEENEVVISVGPMPTITGDSKQLGQVF